jgi:dynein heavy chain
MPNPIHCCCCTQVNAEATKIAKETEEANIIANQVSAELEKALPALQEAEAALNVLTKKDISELKVRKQHACVLVP